MTQQIISTKYLYKNKIKLEFTFENIRRRASSIGGKSIFFIVLMFAVNQTRKNPRTYDHIGVTCARVTRVWTRGLDWATLATVSTQAVGLDPRHRTCNLWHPPTYIFVDICIRVSLRATFKFKAIHGTNSCHVFTPQLHFLVGLWTNFFS